MKAKSRFTCLLLALTTTIAQAQIVSPVGISSSTAGSDFRPADNVINLSGLPDLNGNHSWGSFEDSFVTTAIPGFPNKYDFAGQRPTLVIDMGADLLLAAMHVWGYSGGSGTVEPQSNSLKTFALRFATDAEGPGGFGSSISDNPTFNLDGDNVPANSPPAGLIVPKEDFSFNAPLEARWVEMSLLDNFWGEVQADSGLNFRGGDRVGFGELAFTVVPEPSTYALLLGGLATFVFVVLRRRH